MKRFHPVRLLILGACLFHSSCKPGEKPAEAAKETAAPEALASDAFLVLPGDYAERFTAADLEARFGKANVRRETEPEPRVVLFPDDPTRRAYFTFYEDETFEHLAGISVTDPGSRWRGKQGVHVGMTMAKVRELNGKPFSYFGFDGQKRGRAHDGWSPSMSDDDATLGAFDVSEGEHLYFDIELGVNDQLPTANLPALPVDEYMSSDDPKFPKLGEVIIVTGIGASSSLDDEWE